MECCACNTYHVAWQHGGRTYHGCCCEKPTVEVTWEIPERFRGMKMVEWAISNFGDLYARFEEQEA